MGESMNLSSLTPFMSLLEALYTFTVSEEKQNIIENVFPLNILKYLFSELKTFSVHVYLGLF